MSGLSKIILNSTPESLEDMISPFIDSQFPDFIKSEHRNLIIFIRCYYEWLEQRGNPGYALPKLNKTSDIDTGLLSFYEHFKNTFMESFPSLEFSVSQNGDRTNAYTLMKKIKEFYANKGTENSYKFLFNLLYDSDVDVYVPKNDILKCSDGIWVEPKSIKTTYLNGSRLLLSVGRFISQKSADNKIIASATIDTAFQRYVGDSTIAEFFITNIYGEFDTKLPVFIDTESGEYQENLQDVLGNFIIESPGSGYRIGDKIFIGSDGKGFSAKIKSVGLSGEIIEISIADSGISYVDNIYAIFLSETGYNNSASVLFKTSAITKYPGYFVGNSGKLSSNKYIQDGEYYQTFSYVLRSEISFDRYFSTLKKIVHPAGMKMFGDILFKRIIKTQKSSSSLNVLYENPIIGRYTPYTFSTVLNLRNNGSTGTSGAWLGNTGDLYPLGYNPYISNATEGFTYGNTFIRSPAGTIFVGTSLGYTYCTVSESGLTSHNPLGSPLGSTASWNKYKLSIDSIPGIILHLSPENIVGVGGSTAAGISMQVWNDTSGLTNNGIPPQYYRWSIPGASAGWFVGGGEAGNTTPAEILNWDGYQDIIEKLTPVIGVSGGLRFNGNGIYGPNTIGTDSFYGSVTFGALHTPPFPGQGQPYAFGLNFNKGETASSVIQTGTHFYLTSPINVSSDMDIFLVFESESDGSTYGNGMVSSLFGYTAESSNSIFSDYVLYNTSFNNNDNLMISSDYVYIDNKPNYPIGSGLAGIKLTETSAVSYNPHVSATSMGRCIAEWSIGTLVSSYLNGDISTNSSPTTGMKITDTKNTGITYNNTSKYLLKEQNLQSNVALSRVGAYYHPTFNSFDVPFDKTNSAWYNAAASFGSKNGFKGTIFEIVVFNRKLTEIERQEVYGYLSQKYNLSDFLPKNFHSSRRDSYRYGELWWEIKKHPNSRGLNVFSKNIPIGICFGNIQILDFINMPNKTYHSLGNLGYTLDTYTVM